MRHFTILTHLMLIAALLCLAATSAAADLVEGTTFGSWKVNCETDDGASQPGCFIVQNLVLREGGQRVLQIAVGFVAQAAEPIALLALPLGISLPPGVKIQVDEAAPERIPIERCEPNGCRAGLKLKGAMLDGFRHGKQVSITIYDAKREPIVVPLSLDGFQEGLVALVDNKAEE
jgi:invasion protein IalB